LNTLELLTECKKKGIELIPTGTETLKVKAPESEWTPEMQSEVKAHKQALRTTLLVREVFQGTIISEN
jgi:hypothetical protein